MILRSRIAEIKSTGLSLMPEGLEKKISKPEMADLIAFLRASHRGDEDAPSTGRPGSLDIGTLPGLIEPDDEPVMIMLEQEPTHPPFPGD